MTCRDPRSTGNCYNKINEVAGEWELFAFPVRGNSSDERNVQCAVIPTVNPLSLILSLIACYRDDAQNPFNKTNRTFYD